MVGGSGWGRTDILVLRLLFWKQVISGGSIRGTEELIILTMMGDGDQISVGMGRMAR
jgi:hypothetical protein